MCGNMKPYKPKLKTLSYQFAIHSDGYKLDTTMINRALQDKYGYHFYVEQIKCECKKDK